MSSHPSTLRTDIQHESKDHNAIVNFVPLLKLIYFLVFKQKYANTNFYNKIRIFLKIFAIFGCGRLAGLTKV